MDSDRELARLWRVSKTVHEMIRDRGYEVADYEINMSFDDFKETYGGGGSVDRGRMAFHANHSRDSRDRIYVFFCAEEAVSKATYKRWVITWSLAGLDEVVGLPGRNLCHRDSSEFSWKTMRLLANLSALSHHSTRSERSAA